MMVSIISSARAWLPFLLRPHRSLNNFIACWSSYDAQAWEAPIDLMDSGIKLGLEMLIPALLLGLIGSFMPMGESLNADGFPSYLVQKSMIDALSPYTSHSSALLSSTAINHHFSSNFDLQYLLRFVALSIFSPITMDIIFYHFAPIFIQVFSRLKVVLMSHKGPDSSTHAALSERVRLGRAIRRHAYDLYLPPNTSNASKMDPIKSLLFFPGFGIHHSAYADVASKLSDDGIAVAVVSLEPLRLAHQSLGGGMDDVTRLIKSAGNEVVQYYRRIHRENGGKDSRIIVDWDLGGHSMGGYNVLQLAEELTNPPPSFLLNDGSISRVGSQIVAWGAGPMINIVPNLQEAGPSSPIRVFILLASNDNIARFESHEQKRQLLNKMPQSNLILDTIKGGNHSGFASYDDASKKSNTFLLNGRRDISLEAQHKEAASRTARFLLDDK
ncbi:hypothetical protein ACHAXR_006188 [Thalassiosira sp. AJA248-18]